MMKSGHIVALAALLGPLLCGAVAAEDASAIKPVDEIRTLSRIQNGLTNGQTSGLRVQHIIIRSIGHKFLSAPPEIWSERRNADAAIRFLLSGGNPSFARIGAVQDALPESHRRLFAAALAFAEGGRTKARRLLVGVNPRSLPPMIAGHIALVTGILLSRQRPELARKYLEDARLLGSGTLIEEAALRRQISVSVVNKKFDSFRGVADTYARHYRDSVYLGVFRERFAQNVLAVVDKGNKSRIKWLIDHIKRYNKDEQTAYSMMIAREAVLRGRPEIVAALADLGLDGEPSSADMAAQLVLYKSATSIFGKNPDDGAELLSSVDVERLEKNDMAIYRAASHLLRQIREWPEPKTSDGGAADELPKPALGQSRKSNSVVTILEKGRAKLAAADILLAR
ncbi:MAG: hypothetical protein AAF346_05510 [Pseudomonadota bacterium]